MTRLAYSEQANLDLARIWLWIAQSSGQAQADRVLDKITKRIASLEHFPKLGPPLPALDETARKLVIMRWIVIYSAYGEHVRIVRVVDGATDTRRRILAYST